jgi:hypothetical protein
LKIKFLHIVYISSLVILFGCSPFKHMPGNSFLLDKVSIEVEDKSGLKDELYQNVTQKPNKRFLGMKYHMYLYALSKPEKDKGLSKYFKKIGEEPVIWDSYQTKLTRDNINSYLNQNGYFEALVKDTVFIKDKRKVEVTYTVDPGEAYKVRRLNYEIYDKGIDYIVQRDSLNSIIEKGNVFTIANLVQEKKRVQDMLLDQGYYSFSKEDIENFIQYKVDTSLLRMVDITMVIRNPDLVVHGYNKHYIYRLNNIYIFRNYNPKEFLSSPDYLTTGVDTILYEGLYFLSKKGVRTKPGILAESTYLLPGFNYSQENEELTMRHLRSLKVFRNVEIDFDILEDTVPNYYERLMDGYINLVPTMRQFYQFDVSATNSAIPSNERTGILGNLGAEATLKYQYKNLFGNAEILDLTLRGGAESLFRENVSDLSNSVSIGAEVRLQIPKFITPFRTEEFIKRFSPKTSFSLAYKYYNRPGYYLQNLANFSFGYNWQGNDFVKHSLDPVRLNYVSVEKFAMFDSLAKPFGSFLQESFRNKFITSTDYSFEFNNRGKKGKRDFVYFRFATELGGNLLNAVYNAFDIQDTVSGGSKVVINNIPFTQYTRNSFDFRYYDNKMFNQSIVYRLFVGFAIPYGNSSSVPFEKRFTIGGPNSIRGWAQNYLGPGITFDGERRTRITGSSDIKLEFNAEYRFDIIWKLKGALFIDGGNIWSVSEDETRDGAKFHWDLFYRQIALGSGFGLRFDFDYLILRFDLGIKVFSPAGLLKRVDEDGQQVLKPIDSNWIFKKDQFNNSDGAIQFGVAYPF